MDGEFVSEIKEHLTVIRKSLNGAEDTKPDLPSQSFYETERKKEGSIQLVRDSYKSEQSLRPHIFSEAPDPKREMSSGKKQESAGKHAQDGVNGLDANDNVRIDSLLSKISDCLLKSRDSLLYTKNPYKRAENSYMSPVKIKGLPMKSKLDYYYLSENPYSREYAVRDKKLGSAKRVQLSDSKLEPSPPRSTYQKLHSYPKEPLPLIPLSSSPQRNELRSLETSSPGGKVGGIPFDLAEDGDELQRRKTLDVSVFKVPVVNEIHSHREFSYSRPFSLQSKDGLKRHKKRISNLKEDMLALKKYTRESVKTFHLALSNYKRMMAIKKMNSKSYRDKEAQTIKNSSKNSQSQTAICSTESKNIQTEQEVGKDELVQTMSTLLIHQAVQSSECDEHTENVKDTKIIDKKLENTGIQTSIVLLKESTMQTLALREKTFRTKRTQTDVCASQEEGTQAGSLPARNDGVQTETHCTLDKKSHNSLNIAHEKSTKIAKDAAVQSEECKSRMNSSSFSTAKSATAKERILKDDGAQTIVHGLKSKAAQTETARACITVNHAESQTNNKPELKSDPSNYEISEKQPKKHVKTGLEEVKNEDAANNEDELVEECAASRKTRDNSLSHKSSAKAKSKTPKSGQLLSVEKTETEYEERSVIKENLTGKKMVVAVVALIIAIVSIAICYK